MMPDRFESWQQRCMRARDAALTQVSGQVSLKEGIRTALQSARESIIAVETTPGHVEVLSHPDNGEYANTTFFITEPDAYTHFRIYSGVHSAPSFALMSDGTAESLYLRLSGQTAPALLKLLEWTRELPKAKVEKILTSNLAQVFGARTTDDCSLGILSCLKRL